MNTTVSRYRKKKLHGWKTFIAMFSGEHIAGTEFVIGSLLVMHGVSARDFFLGLLLGNITSQVKPGINTLGVVLGDGWYRGYLGWQGKRNPTELSKPPA